MYPEDLTKQSVVTVSGTVQETKARDYNFEVLAKEITVLSHASRKLPVDPLGRLESGIDNRLNARALDMRNQKTAAVFKIRHHALHSIRNTMEESGFLEITTPKIIASASEGCRFILHGVFWTDCISCTESTVIQRADDTWT